MIRALALTVVAGTAVFVVQVVRADTTVFAWGYNGQGQCNVPGTLGTVTQVAAGEYHTVALTNAGTVTAWGYNQYGQCNVPTNQGPFVQVAVGSYHTVALTNAGTVARWGNNDYGQCGVPPNLGTVTQVAAGVEHTLALKSDGTVACWGRNYEGQCNTPPRLASVTQIAGGYYHTVALKADGAVVAWGYNYYGQCNTPPGIGVVTAIAAGRAHTVALTNAGTVTAWGRNQYGQCNVPTNQGPFVQVAAGGYHTVALTNAGTVARWGNNDYGQCGVPPNLGTVTQVAAGGYHTVAIMIDCLTESSTEPPYISNYSYQETLPAAPVPDIGAIATFTFEELPLVATQGGDLRVRFRAAADLGLGDERLYARFEGDQQWTQLQFANEADCSTPANCLIRYPNDAMLFDGRLIVEVTSSPAVSAQACPEGFVEVSIDYRAETDHDCNNNRLPDYCEIENGILADCNSNHWADSCELARFPENDCDSNGQLDCCDFEAGADDCDRNGTLDRCDIAQNAARDCNANGRLDTCELLFDGATDVNRNLILDSCDIAAGLLADCNHNSIADLIDLANPNNDVDGDMILDSCFDDVVSPDIYVDGRVDAIDLAALIGAWGTMNAPADLNLDGVVGAADLALLLSAWGLIGLCGDGFLDPGENCCNCPKDVSCGEGFDCFYGACVLCPSGQCPPAADDCMLLYGPAPQISYPDYHQPCDNASDEFNCAFGFGEGFFSESRSGGFAMNLLAPAPRESGIAIASVGLLGLLAMPKRWLRRLTRRNQG